MIKYFYKEEGITVRDHSESHDQKQNKQRGLYLIRAYKSQQQRTQSDQDHDNCIRKMADCHEQCIFDRITDRIVKPGKNRINI